MDIFIPVLFWASIPASLALSVVGVIKGKFWIVLLAAVLFLPLAYYLEGSPSYNGFAILLPLFQVASAAALREGNKTWAWILLAPAFLVTAWFVFVVLSYQPS